MKLEIKMCHSHLTAMLHMSEHLEQAVHSYTATAPNVTHEGIAGYMETTVVFQIKDLSKFTHLYDISRARCTPSWYTTVRNGIFPD